MPPLYLVQQNSKIRIRNRRLQVEKENDQGALEILTSLPLSQVEQVVLFGNIGLTTPAIDALLEQNTPVVFLSQRGEYRGRLVGQVTPHVPLRRAQYAALEQPGFALALARSFVRAKLEHQRALLLRNTRQERREQVQSGGEALRQALAALPAKTALSSLRGLEGASTAAYFSALRTFFPAHWAFTDRNRRPPADPVNVLLSLGYTLLANAASAAVETVGLDPFAGFLHEYAYNRPGLALDLMEEFRPLVDGVVMWACNSGTLTPRDFTSGPPERPVVLGDEGKRRFIQAFESRMEQPHLHPLRNLRFPIRQCLIEQARQLADCLLHRAPEYRSLGFH